MPGFASVPVPRSDAKIFPEYIFPGLSMLPSDPEELVRIANELGLAVDPGDTREKLLHKLYNYKGEGDVEAAPAGAPRRTRDPTMPGLAKKNREQLIQIAAAHVHDIKPLKVEEMRAFLYDLPPQQEPPEYQARYATSSRATTSTCRASTGTPATTPLARATEHQAESFEFPEDETEWQEDETEFPENDPDMVPEVRETTEQWVATWSPEEREEMRRALLNHADDV